MMQGTQQTKLAALAVLKATICATPTLTPEQSWFYPSAPPVQGFCGTDPLILVGYRPSYNEWTPSDPGRRRLYQSLAELGAGNAHLTDLYKYRGDIKNAPPLDSLPDFALHLGWLKEEIRILNPVCIVAMGDDACKLLRKYLPDKYVVKAMHFALRPQHVPRYRGSMEDVLNPAYQCLRDDRRI